MPYVCCVNWLNINEIYQNIRGEGLNANRQEAGPGFAAGGF